MNRINEAREKVADYFSKLDGFFLKRTELLRLMTVAVVAQEPMLFVGRPGTAKSLLVTAFCQGLGLKQDEYFEYMLTKFTEPSEIMGPVDIQELKSGKYIRKIEGHLPTAKVVFLDEIFKANSAILNVLLTVINERKFYQEGRPISVPLISMFAASNEIPAFGEFDALKDRFVIKAETLPVRDEFFEELIRTGIEHEQRAFNREMPWRSDCTLEDFLILHDYMVSTVLPNAVQAPNDSILGDPTITSAFKALIYVISEELKVEITDRKLIKLYKLILTQAFIFNGGTVTHEELKLLSYCGNSFSDIKKLKDYIEERLDNLY